MAKLKAFVALWFTLTVLASPFVADSLLAQESQKSSLIVRTFDCRNGDVHDVTSCTPLAGVPIWWLVRAVGTTEMEQTRYTIGDGTDRLDFSGSQDIFIGYDQLVSWTAEDLVPLISGYRVLLDEGQSVTLDLLFVRSADSLPGGASITVRTFDCTNGDPVNLDSCAPIPGIHISVTGHEGGPFRDQLLAADETGSALFQRMVPDFVTVTVPLDQTCFRGHDYRLADFDLVPLWTQQSLWIVPGDSLSLEVVFMPKDQASATPAVGYTAPLVEQQMFDPCA